MTDAELITSLKSDIEFLTAYAGATHRLWDDDLDSKVGKRLLALAGDLHGYNLSLDEIHDRRNEPAAAPQAIDYARCMVAHQVELMSRRYADFIEGVLCEHGATIEDAHTYTMIKDETELGGLLLRAGLPLGVITARIDAHGLKLDYQTKAMNES